MEESTESTERKPKKGLLIGLSLGFCLVIMLAAAVFLSYRKGWILKKPDFGSIYTSTYTGFDTYYPEPTLLPAPYQFDPKKISYSQGVILYQVTGDGDNPNVAISAQPVPEVFKIAKMFRDAQTYSSPLGDIYIESTTEFTRAAIAAGRTLLIFSTEYHMSPQQMASIARSLKKV